MHVLLAKNKKSAIIANQEKGEMLYDEYFKGKKDKSFKNA